MGLQIFSLNNQVLNEMEGRMKESNMRVLIGLGAAFFYLLIGAIVFVRIEYPLEKIERETYLEYQQQWRTRLTQLNIDVQTCVMCLWWSCTPIGSSRYSRLNAVIVFGIFILAVYLIFGARFIQLLEIGNDVAARKRFEIALKDFMERNNVNQSEIDSLFSNIRDAALNGIWMDKNVTSDPNWTFGQAFFFAGTLISTVGYGRVSPRTEHGKLFTIFYCVIGIPLTLALLSAIVARMREPSHKLRGLLNQKFGHLFTVNHIQFLHVGIVLAGLLVFVFMIPAWIFSSIEDDWTFLDAFYYCFVSLTTIGLGDYEPGDKPDQSFRGLYKIMATVYLMCGLCCMMLFLATLYDVPQFNLTAFFVKSDEEMRLNDEDGKYGNLDNPTVVENGYYGSTQ